MASSSLSTRFFTSPSLVFTSAILLRITLFTYGLLQDTYSPMKYTDIDYYVFTDASRFLSQGHSPYERETYRYTPLLAMLLLPTTFQPQWLWFSFGKLLFAISDIVAGWLIFRVLKGDGMNDEKALKFASIWLLNPMVAAISTRGSSEGLLGVMIIALLWAVTQRKTITSAILLGLGVHFKIYPFIYAPSIIWWMDKHNTGSISPVDEKAESFVTPSLITSIKSFFNQQRLLFTLISLSTFLGLNLIMYALYGYPFLQHTYLHHISRLDHRHNFSPYNTILYLSSASSSTSRLTTLAFIPQLLLSSIIIPFLAKSSLPSTMLAQTFAFVTFNKVCTSQYFLWYMVFLPFYLPHSSLLQSKTKGLVGLGAWIGMQVLWLQQGFQLEFLGGSSFVPGLWGAGVGFFVVNCWLLGVVVGDIGRLRERKELEVDEAVLKKEKAEEVGKKVQEGSKEVRKGRKKLVQL